MAFQLMKHIPRIMIGARQPNPRTLFLDSSGVPAKSGSYVFLISGKTLAWSQCGTPLAQITDLQERPACTYDEPVPLLGYAHNDRMEVGCVTFGEPRILIVMHASIGFSWKESWSLALTCASNLFLDDHGFAQPTSQDLKTQQTPLTYFKWLKIQTSFYLLQTVLDRLRNHSKPMSGFSKSFSNRFKTSSRGV